jgi:hypothetical protein
MRKFVVYLIYLYVLLSKEYGSHLTPNWLCTALDKGMSHISSWPQLQATAVQIDVTANPDIDSRLEFLLFQVK